MRRDGFTKAANGVLFDDRLSLQARAVYPMLLHVAWTHRPDVADGDVVGKPVRLPAKPELAALLGLSEPSFKRYLNELREAGYVETARPQRRGPLVYRIYARPASESDHQRPDASGQERPDYARASERVGDEEAKTDVPTGTSSEPPPWDELGDPPKLAKNETCAFDVLAAETGTSTLGPRATEVATALHGRRRNLAVEPGINRLFWLEMATHYGRPLHEVRARAAANPDAYQAALVAAIKRKAALYRDRRLGMLTPTSLAKWWLDLETTQRLGKGMAKAELDDFRRTG